MAEEGSQSDEDRVRLEGGRNKKLKKGTEPKVEEPRIEPIERKELRTNIIKFIVFLTVIFLSFQFIEPLSGFVDSIASWISPYSPDWLSDIWLNRIITFGISLLGATLLSMLELVAGILLLGVFVGMFAIGPTLLSLISDLLPADFGYYLSCLENLFTGDVAGFQLCIEGKPAEAIGERRILDIKLGYEEKLYTPIGGLYYDVPVRVENRNPDEPVDVSFSGYLLYDKDVKIGGKKEKREVVLLLKPTYCTREHPCEEITKEESITLVSEEKLDCTTKRYKKLVAEVNYPYSSYGRNGFKIADSRKTMDIASAGGPFATKGPGPVGVGVYFEPDHYILGQTTRKEVNMFIVVKNELRGENYANINGIRIDREGAGEDELLKLKECTCGQWGVDFSDEGVETRVTGTKLEKTEHRCMCTYEVEDPEGFLEDVAFKTVSFRVSVGYDYTRVVSRTDIPRADFSRCPEDKGMITEPSEFCDVGDVTQKLKDAEERHGIPNYLLVAVAQAESKGEHCKDGRVKVGDSGEVGLMQLMPGKCGFSVYELSSVDNNIECAARTLKGNYEVYEGGVTKEWLDKCDECCHNPEYQEKYIGYTRWDAALRAYNGWNCPKVKVNYVESVKSIQNKYIRLEIEREKWRI